MSPELKNKQDLSKRNSGNAKTYLDKKKGEKLGLLREIDLLKQKVNDTSAKIENNLKKKDLLQKSWTTKTMQKNQKEIDLQHYRDKYALSRKDKEALERELLEW